MKSKDKDETTDEFIERKIIIGLITSNDYASCIARVYKPDCLESEDAKILAEWCLDYFKKYNRVPGRDIENIYLKKCKEGLSKDRADGIGQILQSLSNEYERDDFNVDFLLEETVKHFQYIAAKALLSHQNRALHNRNYDEFYRLHAEFKPAQFSDLYEDESINAGELYTMEIKGPTWLVKDLIPIGLTILGGRSKVGKSYFMLNLAMALAQGKYLFGDKDSGFRGQKGQILYLSLEDTKQRFQKRMREIDPQTNLTLLGENLRLRFQWDKFNRGGLEAITAWVEKMTSPKLVVVDTLAKVWSKSSKTAGGGLYAEEYAIYSPLADLAHGHQISIILVTHTTKGHAADVFDEILGGMGTQGPADNLIVLANDQDGHKRLSIRGKDIEEKNLAFENPGGPGSWRYLGEAGEIQKTAERKEIIDILVDSDQPMTLTQIRAELENRGSGVATVHIILRKMVKDGVLEQPQGKYGPYAVAGNREKKANAMVAQRMKKGSNDPQKGR